MKAVSGGKPRELKSNNNRVTDTRSSAFSPLLADSSAEMKRIHLALRIFKQLESLSERQLVDENEFLDALRKVGLDDRDAQAILDVLHNAGQVYEVKPLQYRSIRETSE